MMRFGLADNIINTLIAIFEANPKVDKAIIFGSRAKGNFRQDSDIDIAVKGYNLDMNDVLQMGIHFEDIKFDLKLDLINFLTISEPALVEHINRVGVEIYSRWKEYKLSHFVKFGNGKERPKTSGNFPVFGGNGVLGYCDKYNYDGETIIIGRVGAYCGSVFYQNNPIWVSDNALAAKPKNGYNAKFFYYYLKNLNLNSYAEGSSHPLVTQTLLNSIDLFVTENVEIQTAIAEVLSSLDDKIDLLHRQNKTLEQMAETLFRQWFVEEAEENWEVGTIADAVSIKGGTTPSTKEPKFWDGDINWTSPRDLSDNNSIFLFDTSRKITEEGLKQVSSGLLPNGTLLLSSRAPIGYLAITEIPVAINQGYIAMICDKIASIYFMYFWCKTNMEMIENAGNGSVFQEISKSAFKTLDFTIPSKIRLKHFDNEVEPIFRKIKFNTLQINKLITLRDTLLPKLMSGEERMKL